MLGEIPYMLVWGFFSAMGWMGANWAVDKVLPDKPPAIEKKVEEKKDGGDSKLSGQEK